MSIAENQKELLEMASEYQQSAVDQVLDFILAFNCLKGKINFLYFNRKLNFSPGIYFCLGCPDTWQ